jgi:hypothetical protein
MIERRNLRSPTGPDLRHTWAIVKSLFHRPLAAAGVIALLACALLFGASTAAAVPLGEQRHLNELWSEFPLDPHSRRDAAATKTRPVGPSARAENIVQSASQATASQAEESKPTRRRDSDSDALPLPLPVLLVLSLGAAILLWLLAVAPEGTFRRSRASTVPSIVPRVQVALGRGQAVRRATSLVPPMEVILGGGRAAPETTTDNDSAAPPSTPDSSGSAAPVTTADSSGSEVSPAPASESSGSDRLAWVRGEVESARRGHDVLSLLLVRSDRAAGAGPEEDIVPTVASAIEEALHDVPHKLRQDGALLSVVLPHTLAEGAKRLAARIPLFLTEAMPEPRTPVNLRIAVACFPRDAATAEEILQICERALRRGRTSLSAAR